MKRIIFYFLSFVSFVIRPFRHGWYMVVLQKAYEIQGVHFSGKASYIHHDVYIDNLGGGISWRKYCGQYKSNYIVA